MGGLITGLLEENRGKKQADFDREWHLWSSLAGAEGLAPDARQVAHDNLARMAGHELGIPKQHHGTLGKLFGGMHDHLANMNPNPENQWKAGGKGGIRALPQPGDAIEASKQTDLLGRPILDAAPGYHPISDAYAVQDRARKAQEDAQNKTTLGTADLNLANAKAEQERQQDLKTLKDAGVDPTSPEGRSFLLHMTGARNSGAGELDDTVIALRKKYLADAGVKEGTPAYQEFMLTGKMPTGFGKPETPAKEHIPTEDEAAYQAYAEKHGTTTDKLTGQQRLEALRDKKLKLKVGGEDGAPAKTGAEQIVDAFQPGGPSIANPGMKDQYIEMAAWQWITSRTLPFTGMGSGKKGEKNKRELAVARGGEILKELGIEPFELEGLRDNLKANARAFGDITKMGAMMGQFEGTLNLNMQLATKLSKRFERTDSPFLNRIQGGIERNTGNGAVDNFNLQMRTLAVEYAKIMAGQTSSTGAKIGDVEEATKLINGFVADKNLDSLFKVIRTDIQNRQTAVNQTKTDLLSQIRKPQAGFGNTPAVFTPEPGVKQKRKRINPKNPNEVWFSNDFGKTWSHTTDGKNWSAPQPWAGN